MSQVTIRRPFGELDLGHQLVTHVTDEVQGQKVKAYVSGLAALSAKPEQ